MKCLAIFVALLALVVAQSNLEDTQTSFGPPAEQPEQPAPVEEAIQLDENAESPSEAETNDLTDGSEATAIEGEESVVSDDENQEEAETGEALAAEEPQEQPAELEASQQPAAAAEEVIKDIVVDIIPNSSAAPKTVEEVKIEVIEPAPPASPQGRALFSTAATSSPSAATFGPSAATFGPSAATFGPPASTRFPTFAPKLFKTQTPTRFFSTPAPAKQPTLLDIVSRLPPTRTPVINYRNKDDSKANLIDSENEINPDGSYKYRYVIDNGIQAEAAGQLVGGYADADLQSLAVKGSFSWTSDNGQTIYVTYTADENGYRPQSDAIPTSPPIPPLIAKALAYIERQRLQQPSLI